MSDSRMSDSTMIDSNKSDSPIIDQTKSDSLKTETTDRLSQQLEFISELDKLKAIKRKALIKCDDNRYENSAEHSWHIAMAAQVLHPYAEEPVDLARVTQMLLIHDIVEIDAGDTFAFAEQVDLDAQAEKEERAANRIFGMLPGGQFEYMKALFVEFEECTTADGRFAKAIDRILPLIQNVQNDGGSWAQHSVKKSQVLARNRYLEDIAPKLWVFVQEQIDLAARKGWLVNE